MYLELEDFETLIKSTGVIPVKRSLAVRSEPACGEGENFCSFIYRIELDVLLDSGDATTLRLIAKLAPTRENKVMYDHVNELSLFSTESKIYQALFPAAELLIKQKKFPHEPLWPELIGANSAGTVLLLEDLKFKGYRSVDVESLMDLDQALLVMEELGRYHALSLAVIEEKQVDPQMFSSKWLWTNETMSNKFFVQPLLRLSRAMKHFWGTDWSQAADTFHQAHFTVLERMNEISFLRKDRLNVINHGDTWMSNILFKYDANGKPSSTKFIDFQLSNYGSFAIDLTNFLTTSVKSKVRRASYNRLLDTYRASLTGALQHYGLELKEKTSRETIMREMDRLKFYGFLMLISIHAFCLSSSTLKIGLTELDMLAAGEEVDAFNKLYVDSEFRESVEDDFKDLLKCGDI